MNRATLGVRCHRIKKYIPIYLMLLPGAIYLLINNYIPHGRNCYGVQKSQLFQGYLGK